MSLDTRVTELIALGAAVAANCATCLEHHLGKAREAGIDTEDVTAALEVGRMVRRGAAGVIDRIAGRSDSATPAAAAPGAAAHAAPAPRGKGCCG